MQKQLCFVVVLFFCMAMTGCTQFQHGNKDAAKGDTNNEEKIEANNKSGHSDAGRDSTTAIQRDSTTLDSVDVSSTDVVSKEAVDKQFVAADDSISALRSQINDLQTANAKYHLYLVGGLSLLFVLLIVLFWISLKNSSKIEVLKRWISKNKKSSHASHDIVQSSLPTEDIAVLYRRVDEITLKLETIENNMMKEEQASSKPEGKKSVAYDDTVPETNRKFYMTRALNDGMFFLDARSPIQDESTYYTFLLDRDDANRATFEFTPYDDIRIKKAFNNRHETIENACDLSAEPDAEGKGYQCIEPGIANLTSNGWKVIKKAVVHYE